MTDLENKLNDLKYEDIYTLILYALAELRNVPEYKTISEAAYVLDKKSLIAFFEYFGGMTIKVPTINDFKLVVNSLLLYEYINLEHLTMGQALREINDPNLSKADLQACYSKIVEVMSKYNFKRDWE